MPSPHVHHYRSDSAHGRKQHRNERACASADLAAAANLFSDCDERFSNELKFPKTLSELIATGIWRASIERPRGGLA